MRPRSGFARVNSGAALVALLVDGAVCLVTSSQLKLAHVETTMHVHTLPIHTHMPASPLLHCLLKPGGAEMLTKTLRESQQESE